MIIVNGGSSAGKSSIVRRMQDQFRDPWLATSIDDFVASLPRELQQSADGFDVSAEGAVQIRETFTRLETAWMTGIAATARAGAPAIVDDVFLGARPHKHAGPARCPVCRWPGSQCTATRSPRSDVRARGLTGRQAWPSSRHTPCIRT